MLRQNGDTVNILEAVSDSSHGRRISLEYTEIDLPGDIETPVSAYLKLRKLGACFLLESAEDPTSIGRYTFIGIAPLLTLELGDNSTLINAGSDKITIEHKSALQPFSGLQRILDTFTVKKQQAELPLLGGLVGFTSYEIVKFFEPRLQPLLPTSEYPLGLYYFVDTLLVFDHYTRRMRLLRLQHEGESLTGGAHQVTLDEIREALAGQIERRDTALESIHNGYHSNFEQPQFEEIVEKAQKHIFAGDIFQVVVSQRETHKTTVDPFYVYRALRMLNPSPYMFYLQFDNLELIGSSPEALVKLQGRRALVRPIAGTRRRGRSEEEDHELARELKQNEKERAEHIMLVDLGRNDLGRVCDYGSVNVSSLMRLEHYSHVMHLTSVVEGTLNKEFNQFDLLRSTFPAGTVSGAPKLRAMEIIADLERQQRGPYAGAVGYFSLSGDIDMCITIRTIVKRGDSVHLQGGAGIVADSVPEQEYKETRNKIAALKQAVQLAEEGKL